MNSKQAAAEKAVSFIQNDMIVGLGTGSTAYWAIEGIGRRIKEEGLRIKAIATSKRSEEQARGLQIPIFSFAEIDSIDVTIDGADEVDSNMNLIKGGGGALLREKIVASNTTQLIIVVDENKRVQWLGKFPLPVEVAIFGWEKTCKKLEALGCIPRLRTTENQPYITDNGNYIIDCDFKEIKQPQVLHEKMNAIVGVMENGLFIGMTKKLIVGYENGETRTSDWND
ncbi:MAG: ribose-5-phosphate isomerase RpiA [Bacteroidetes bacterium]|nr:ribose-5-phosphate isomerase RpiA [Bacteroidota bacterium]